jgi:nucleoside phosphorylase
MNQKYNPILILTALPFESRTILSHYNINIKPKKLTTYQLVKSIYLIEMPIGFHFNLSILSQEVEKISPKLIVNFGICGALDSSIPLGSAFQIENVCHVNKKLSEIRLPEIKLVFQPTSLFTVNEPVLEMKKRDELYSQTRCRLVDMEAFHIASYCKAHRLSLLIIKIASDLADEDSLNTIKANRSELKRALANAYKKLMSDL